MNITGNEITGIETIQGKSKGYTYGLVYLLDKVILCETKDLDFKWENCLEAYFFGDIGELRVWRENGELVSAEYSGEGEYIISEYALDSRYSNRWTSLLVKKFLDYDDDGQVFVSGTTLYGLGRNI